MSSMDELRDVANLSGNTATMPPVPEPVDDDWW